ncbi:hypothetical protein [Rubrolithibacter danxiaensis]|uniref:hypothetical protein n=1 Tax=Rubrolithibacter danxiaensis TaxID=3390805 RepID=UPI003BF8EFAB
MRSFKTNFPIDGVPTFVTVIQMEDGSFSVELESTGMDEDKDPKKETVAAMRTPDLLVQHTKNGTWIILDQGTFDLNNEDLQALGRAIENNSPNLI